MLSTRMAYVRHDIILLSHDAMPSCGVSVSVRLSVCPSVTFVDCVETNKHIFKIFSLSGSLAILLNGGVECRWGRQKSRF